MHGKGLMCTSARMAPSIKDSERKFQREHGSDVILCVRQKRTEAEALRTSE